MSGQGFTTKVGVKKQGAFGTAIQVTELVTYTDESITKDIELYESSFLDGTMGVKQLYKSFESGAGSIDGEAVIDEITTDIIGFESFLYGLFGYATYNATLGNVYKPSSTKTVDQVILPNLTVAVDKYYASTRKIIELKDAKVNSFNMSGAVGTDGGKVKWGVELIGTKKLITGDSGIVNTTGYFDAITPTAKPQHLNMSRATLKIGDQVNVLADGDRIGISEFEWNASNVLNDPQFSSVTGTHTDGTLPIEFERNGRMQVSLRIVRPRLSDLTFHEWWRDNTSLQAQLEFATPGGTYSHKVYFPYLKVNEDPRADVGGAELLTEEINLIGLWNTVNINPYMSAIHTLVGPIAYVAKSKRTAVP